MRKLIRWEVTKSDFSWDTSRTRRTILFKILTIVDSWLNIPAYVAQLYLELQHSRNRPWTPSERKPMASYASANEDVPMVQQKSGIVEQLETEKKKLQQRLSDIDNTLDKLRSNPEVTGVLEMLARLGVSTGSNY